MQKAKKMVAELEREMLEIELKVDDLDKMELYGGVEVETYKIHAKKLLVRVMQKGLRARIGKRMGS